jgi:hypothetical protein
MVSSSSRFGMVMRAVIAGVFLLLAALQPGLAAAISTDGTSRTVTAVAGHQHDGDGIQDEEAARHVAGDQHYGKSSDHHQPDSMDLCCEMHCLMSQAMPGSSPVIHGPAASRFRGDFGHALPDGQISSVIKPPRTTS